MKSWVAMAGFLAVALVAGEGRTATIRVNDEAWIDLKGFLQAWGQATEDGAPDGESMGKELFVRRARLMLTGQVLDGVGFLISTDASNIGKNGDVAGTLGVQDAFGSIRLIPGYLHADVGLFLPPFLHHGTQSAASLVGLDVHGPVYRYLPVSGAWRDTGVQLRAGLFADRLQLRAAAFNGLRGKVDPAGDAATRNPDDALRYTGSLRVNLLEPEPDFFTHGTWLGMRRVLSFGVAGDTQTNGALSADGRVEEYRAYGADVYLDLPFTEDRELVFQAMAARWWNGEDALNSGVSAFVEGSFRFGQQAPYVVWERFYSDAGRSDAEIVHVGLTHYVRGHSFNVKADLALERTEVTGGPAFDDVPWRTVGTVGIQLYL